MSNSQIAAVREEVRKWKELYASQVDTIENLQVKIRRLKAAQQEGPYETLQNFGIDYDRLKGVMDSKDNWSSLVHAFEAVTTISVVIKHWPEDQRG